MRLWRKPPFFYDYSLVNLQLLSNILNYNTNQHDRKVGLLLRSKVHNMRLNNGFRFVGVTVHGLYTSACAAVEPLMEV